MRELVRGRSPIKNSQSVPGVQTVKLLHITIICQRKILQKQWICLVMISSVQSLSCVWLFATPWTTAHQASLSITISRSLLKLMSIESVMPSSHLILCRPFLLLTPSPPNIRVFSSESTLRMRWPKYWSFSFSISPSNEHPGENRYMYIYGWVPGYPPETITMSLIG